MNFSNYDRYEGDWVNDVTMGKCKYTFSNGDYYEGIFRNLKIEIALVIALKKKTNSFFQKVIGQMEKLMAKVENI